MIRAPPGGGVSEGTPDTRVLRLFVVAVVVVVLVVLVLVVLWGGVCVGCVWGGGSTRRAQQTRAGVDSNASIHHTPQIVRTRLRRPHPSLFLPL